MLKCWLTFQGSPRFKHGTMETRTSSTRATDDWNTLKSIFYSSRFMYRDTKEIVHETSSQKRLVDLLSLEQPLLPPRIILSHLLHHNEAFISSFFDFTRVLSSSLASCHCPAFYCFLCFSGLVTSIVSVGGTVCMCEWSSWLGKNSADRVFRNFPPFFTRKEKFRGEETERVEKQTNTQSRQDCRTICS